MNDAIETLYTKLKDGVTLVSGRIARGLARQGEQLPLIEFHVSGGDAIVSHTGERELSIEFNIDALNLESASNIAVQLRDVIDGLGGSAPAEGDLVTFTDSGQAGEPDETIYPSNSPLNQGAQTFARHSVTYSISYITL